MFAVRVVALIAVALAVPIIFAQALATAHAEPIRVAYRAPSRCPDESHFRAEIFARTALARSAAAGERAREFAVDVAERPDGSLSGSLEIHSANGAVSRRDMTASQCGELVSALALMVALAVDPEGASLSASGPAPQSHASPPLDAGPVATWTTPTAASTTAMPAPAGSSTAPFPTGELSSPRAPTPSAQAAVTENETAPPMRRHGHWAVGTEALMLVGLVPETAIGASTTVDYDFGPNRPLSAAMRFALSTAVATPKFQQGVRATLLWVWGHAEGCPIRLRVVGSLQVAPCLGLDGGFLTYKAAGLKPNDKLHGWFAAEAAARLGWTFAGRWLAQAAVSALAPLQSGEIVYGAPGVTEQTAYNPGIPYFALQAELGLAGWLP